MRRLFIYGIFSLCLLAIISPGYAFSQFSRAGDKVVIEESEVIESSFFAVAGESVDVYGTIQGDLYVAGGSVFIDGTVEGDVLAAGGQVVINGEVLGDVRSAGGNISIGGSIGQNVSIAGGNIDVESNATIGGGGVVVGGNISVLGDVSEDVLVAGGNTILGGLIGRNVEVYGEQLSLTPDSQISGELAYNDDISVSLSEGASISAGTREIDVPTAQVDYSEEQAENFFSALNVGYSLISFISYLILGLLMIWLLPNYMVTAIRQFGTKKLQSFGFGFLVLVGTPIAIILMLITVVLFPIAILTLITYIALLMISKVYFSYWLGRVIVNRIRQDWNPLAVYALGLLVFYILKAIPFVGGFISAGALLAGLGMIILGEYEIYKTGRKAKLL